MKDPNCIFCKIARKEIPSQITHEGNAWVAFLDIHPKAPGHTLIVPKDHYPWFIDTPDELSDELFRAAKVIAKKLKVEHKADYVRLGIVGTDIAHTHIHLIPLKLKDSPETIDEI